MKTLVATSINPYSRKAYQSACFYGWRKLGYQVRSFNNKQERELLLKSGFDPLDIVELSREETALDLFGKAIPRILPILVRSIEMGAENIILVNSDIYPGHSEGISDYLGGISDTIAMTRSDFIAQPKPGYSGESHYRGGLDIFFFTASGLQALLDGLSEIPVAERMTFGIPGWDFFLGHEIVHGHSGVIMDSAVMFHQHHKTSYSDAKEFDSYASHLFDSGVYRNRSGVDLVSEFSSTIQNQCIRNEDLSRKLCDQYYDAFKIDYENTGNSKRISLVNKKYTLIKKRFSIKLVDERDSLAPLIFNQSSGEYWEGAVFYKNTKLSDMSPIEGYLLVLLIAMLVKDSHTESYLTTTYPVGNLHNKVLKSIIENPGDEGVEAEVLKLFASELVDYSIFNMDLFRYIALSSCTQRSLALCNGVLLLCQKGLVRNTANYYYVFPPISSVVKAGLEANIDNSDITRNLGMARDADYIESASLIVAQNIVRLKEGGVAELRSALYVLSFFEYMLIPVSDRTDESETVLYDILGEPIRRYIKKQKRKLLEDFQNLA